MKEIASAKLKGFIQSTLLQVYYTYIQSIHLILMAALTIGIVMAIQAQIGLSFLGRLENLGQILNTIIFREFTPLFITILIIIRSITAITSEIATMKVNKEILALQIMGININYYLILPRIVAGSISFFCMAYTFFLIALVGFWMALNFTSDVSFSSILYFFIITLKPTHIIIFSLKTLLIGAILVQRACKHGLSLKKASFEVPIVTNKSVVECLIIGIALQVTISLFSYLVIGVTI